MTVDSDSTMQDVSIDFKDNRRELVLTKLFEAIDFLYHKSLNGNVRDEKKEKVRIHWFKTLSYTCSIYNQISRDTELDELKEDMEELKKLIKDEC